MYHYTRTTTSEAMLWLCVCKDNYIFRNVKERNTIFAHGERNGIGGGGCPPSSSGCRQGLRMAPHDDDGDGGAGIGGGSIVESVCCPRSDGVFLTSYVSYTLFLLLFLSILLKIFN